MIKGIIISSIAVFSLLAALFLISPVFARSGNGSMMGGNYSQNWGPNGCPMFDGDSYGKGNYNSNGRGMMGNWR